MFDACMCIVFVVLCEDDGAVGGYEVFVVFEWLVVVGVLDVRVWDWCTFVPIAWLIDEMFL